MGCTVASVLLLIACNGGGGKTEVTTSSTGVPSTMAPAPNPAPSPLPLPGGPPVTGKSIFSIWNNGFYTFDLRALAFGVAGPIAVSFNGQSCTCSALFSGDQARGTYAISGCTGTPLCGSYSATGNYFREFTGTLAVCTPTGQCTDFQ